MGWFNKKTPTSVENPPEDSSRYTAESFRFYYLYGFANQPATPSADLNGFAKLYAEVIGATGGVCFDRAFHPYQLINAKGTSVWLAAYAWIMTRPEKQDLLRQLQEGAKLIQAPVSAAFTQQLVWPDERLSFAANPAFATYQPFVLPFLVWNDASALRWDQQIDAGMRAGDTGPYLANVNQALHFLLPAPAFVIGLDEFDEQRPFAMVDRFVQFLPGSDSR